METHKRNIAKVDKRLIFSHKIMKLSIITINYNNLEGLKRTYDSVVSQTCQDFEWIIIDGGSTDGSKEFIEEHQDHFAYWCSERDKGIYNAMNKGIGKATGEYLQFLNSGDNLVDDRVVAEFLALGWDEDFIAGDVRLDGNENNVKIHPEVDELDFTFFYREAICHQALFIKHNIHMQYGGYDESLHIVSDWKFFLECILTQGCSYRHWTRVVVDYMLDGVSSKPENYNLYDDERARVLSKYKIIVSSIEKRDRRIQELDLPVIVILHKKIKNKIRRLFS